MTKSSRFFGPNALRLIRYFCISVLLAVVAIGSSYSQEGPPPAQGGDDSFVQMWVDPKTFFRPCPDPEITDRECQVSLDGGPVDRTGACPWPPGQLSGDFVKVSDDHLRWMCGNWQRSYTGDPKTSYPWTGLGYTYDWGDHLHPQGQSEFVVPPGTTVWIEGIFTPAEYCG